MTVSREWIGFPSALSICKEIGVILNLFRIGLYSILGEIIV